MFRNSPQARFWTIMLAIFIGLFWLFKPVLFPFLAGMAIAYFLNPVVDKLSHKIPRWLSVIIVLLGFGIASAILLSMIVPLLQSQVVALIAAAPSYVAKIRDHYVPWIETWVAQFDPDDVEKIRNAATDSAGSAAAWLANVLKNVITGGFALIDLIALTIVTPVVAFFMMRDWKKLTQTVDSLLPRRHYKTIREQLHEIDATLSGFMRGQALVCLALGFIYSIGLTAVGLQYGATIGIISGVLSFIPFVGTGFGWITSLVLALVQFDHDPLRVGLVVGVFLIGHVMESYVLTPKLVGDRVGLHSLWVLFALIAGAKLMGFTGVLIAVPAAAVIGVLMRFGVKQYKNSTLYKDTPATAKPKA